MLVVAGASVFWSKSESSPFEQASVEAKKKRARDGALFMEANELRQSLLPNKRRRNRNKLRKSR